MSNTSNISPYDFYDDVDLEENTDNVSYGDTETTGKTNRRSLSSWLLENLQPSEEQLACIQAIEQTSQQKYDALEATPVKDLEHLSVVTTVKLHLNNLPQLLDSAGQLGYAALPVSKQYSDECTLLQHTNGTRIAISQNDRGCLRLHSLGDEQQLHNLVGINTQNQVLKFLKEKGLQFESVHLSTGEMQILAQEKYSEKSGESACIKAEIKPDGATWIDIDRCEGNRCGTIVQQVATAVGGKITGMKKKDSWHQLPGESTKTRNKTKAQVKLS